MVSVQKILVIMILLACAAYTQEVPQFEVADNTSLGMIPVLLDRWGCTIADIDRNGWPDIYNYKWRGNLDSQLYLNQDGFFTDIFMNSPQLRQAEQDGYAVRTPVFADFDNDGDRDLMIGFDYTHKMFRNDDNVFVDITEQLGMVSKVPGFVSVYGYEMSAWTDWDGDGDLDALMVQTNNPDYIFYRNDGNKFVDIAAEVGLKGQNALGNNADRGYHTTRIQWVDWDNDGDADLSAGYKLFRKEGGFLTEVSQQVGFLTYQGIRFCDWFDYDVDGDLDFFIQGSSSNDEIWQNEGGKFVNATHQTNLDLFTKATQVSLNIGDFDNDGDEDGFFSMSNYTDIDALLLNVEEGGVRNFLDVAQFAGFSVVGDRKGAAILDYDMDGKLDVVSSSMDYGTIVYHNLGTATPRNWVGFDLWGTKSNKDALGTWVTVFAEGKKYVRYTKAARTWKIQDNPFVHFGLNMATTIDSVVIRWPLGNVQVLKNVTINQYHKIVETTGTSVKASNIKRPELMMLSQNYPNPFNPETRIEFQLPVNAHILLEIYNLSGQKVVTLIDGSQSAGSHSVVWNGRDNQNQILPSGMYLYQLSTDRITMMNKMLFIR